MDKDCPLMDKKTMKKTTERGYLECYKEEERNILMVRWHDNNAVTVCSNFEGVNPKAIVRRWSQAKKEYIYVEQPSMIENYNVYMGGTDQMDQQVSTYRPTIKNKKWYFPIFVFMIEVSCYNAWIVMKKLDQQDKTIAYVDFIRVICTTYLTKYKTERQIGRKVNSIYGTSAVANRVTDSVRFDGLHHYIGMMEKKSRCALCLKTVKTYCIKCDVKLHMNCFAPFHGVREAT